MNKYYQIIVFLLVCITQVDGIALGTPQSEIDSLKSAILDKKGTQKVNLYNRISREYWNISPDSSLKYARRALQHAQELDNRPAISDAYNRIGNAYYLMTRREEAVSSYNKSLNIRKNLNDPERMTQIYNNLGVLYENSDTPETALDYYQNALNISKNNGLDKKTGRYIMAIARYYNTTNDYKKAIEFYYKSKEHFENLNDTAQLGEANIHIGRIYRKLSSYDEALEYYLKAVDQIEKSSNPSQMANAFNEMGIIYENLDNYDKALDYYNRSLAIYEKQNQQAQKASIYNNMGIIYHDQENYEKALEFYQKSYDTDNKTNDLNGLANSINNMGLVYLEMEQYSKALEYLNQSLDYSRKLNNQHQIANAHNNIGKVLLNTGQYDEAEASIQRGLELSMKIKANSYTNESYELLSRLYEARGDHQRALEYFKMHYRLHDTIFSREKQNRISEMQVKYETKQKEKEIELLKKDNQINKLEIIRQKNMRNYVIICAILLLALAILSYNRFKLKKKSTRKLEEKNRQLKEANERLRDSEYTQRELNATKNKFFSIIAHDLKNPFQALFGISEVLYRNLDDMDREEIREYCKSIYESSNNLYNLLENLLQWSRTQLGNLKLNPQSLPLKETTDEIIDLLRINIEEKDIQVRNEIGDFITAYVDKNVFGTILRNLLSNAIKFTEEKGVVTISAETEPDRTVVALNDTGKGIPKEQLDHLFRVRSNQYTKGTSDEQGTGLGLILCKELVEKSRGQIWAESEVGKGSTFKFTLPKEK